ncbi:MAG: PaaI family thioesterase [Leucobacter sp.]
MTNTSSQADASQREITVRWRDPAEGLAALPALSGLEYLQKMASGELPGAPIASHIGMEFVEVNEGTVTFTCQPNESHYNPIGMVHGGVVCTLLDSALGCATQTLLPAGIGYTSIEIKVNYLRPVTADSGPLTCVGRVTKPGRRVTFAEGEVVDKDGKVVATASGSLLIFPIERAQ